VEAIGQAIGRGYSETMAQPIKYLGTFPVRPIHDPPVPLFPPQAG
jgi:hypothetical protein